jgi:carbonic anhydrase
VLTYQREFIKGYWRKQRWELPIHAFYDIYRESMPLFLNLLTFFLPMALSDGVFRDYSSAAEILDAADDYDKACPSENQILEVIHFKEGMLETPVFRQFNELDIKKSSGKARGADAFGKAFVELGHRSGYVRNVTVGACRRWALMEAGMTIG